MQDIKLKEIYSLLEVENAMDFAAAIKELKAQKSSNEVMLEYVKSQQETTDALTKMVNQLIIDRENHTAAMEMEDVKKSYGTLGSLDPTSSEYQKAKASLIKYYGSAAVEIASAQGLKQVIAEPIHRDVTEDYEGKLLIKRSWDRLLTFTRIKGGVAFQANGEIQVDPTVMKACAEKLVQFNDKGAAKILELLNSKNAYDTINAGEGGAWIPTTYSTDLADLILQETRVLGMFESFTMTSKTMKYPHMTSEGGVQLMPETVLSSDYHTSKATATIAGTGTSTFEAKKAAALRMWSFEVEDDEIVGLLDVLLRDAARALARGKEDWFLNGSALTNNHDNAGADGSRLWANTGDSPTTDIRNGGDGLRRMVRLQAATTIVDAVDGSDMMSKLRKLRPTLGELGTDTDRGCYIASNSALIHLMEDPDLNTMEKFGQNASIVAGNIFAFDTIPVITSPKQREDYAATGLYTGAGQTRTVAHYVHRDSVKIGNRQLPTLFQGNNPLSQLNYLLLTERLDIKKVYPDAYKTVAELRNIPSLG